MFGVLIFTLIVASCDVSFITYVGHAKECHPYWEISQFVLEHEDYWYVFVLDRTGTWYDALKDCGKQGGHLTDIQSTEENDFIFDTLKMRHPSVNDIIVWIAFTNHNSEDIWVGNTSLHISDTNVQYTNWANGEPINKKGNKQCAVMDVHDNGEWSARPCGGEEKHGWVCKYPITTFIAQLETL